MQFIKSIIALSLAAFVLAVPVVQPAEKRQINANIPANVDVDSLLDAGPLVDLNL
ncbi:hypothetical protein B0F90DRAFT_1820030 [Multifurca ochricompacta]|uniref:Uncharacterized protein n=1 Tax=Multifurca ochricompacta TaxID=376703 RepID=A0AAD4M064_9AGAM|nr:hypothetical protein B0F90DRAFT_1820030 [Multifurca ochricompacta]